MKISVLASGSKGNCVYLEGEGSALLVDAGRSARELLGTKTKPGRLAESGGRADMIDGILVTHEHGDHIKGLAAVGNNLKKTAYGTVGTMDAFIRQRTGPVRFPVQTVKCGTQYEIGGFLVEPFAVSHDATEPCGYLISEGSTRLCYCTDTGIVTESMMSVISRADGVILESNHCPEMLRAGPYPEFLKRRIAGNRGHLSNPDAAAVLREIGDSIHLAILAHLSEENNEPGLALSSAQEGLSFHAESVELFAASTVELEGKAPVRKVQGTTRETCSDECWRYQFSL
ncbi:MAG TPA: MBL fold metallo-hydrolase [Methanospirillum sp.]|uniref:MBL fold metallo-hydrolase n=1 Tax=Methanospirillum sp. TaxID=45200 RepID=UPI002BDD4A34|nr:MBL fold metallo-hydrolase [Methanospirillum sp.]HWQ64037.1 MBL fold metallo-hydrolase [Methanospirillum sp.]